MAYLHTKNASLGTYLKDLDRIMLVHLSISNIIRQVSAHYGNLVYFVVIGYINIIRQVSAHYGNLVYFVVIGYIFALPIKIWQTWS
jgi:hypothetical protein